MAAKTSDPPPYPDTDALSSQLVECEFANAGCDVKVPKEDLAKHMTENAQQHLMSATLLNLRLTRELNQKMEEKDRQIADLQKQLEKLSTTSGYVCHELVLNNFTTYQEKSATGEWYSEVVSDGLGVFKVQLKIDTNGIKRGCGHMAASLIPSDIAIQLGQTAARLAPYLVVTLHLLNQLGDYGHHVVMDSMPALHFKKPHKLSTGDRDKYLPLSALGLNSTTKTQYLVNNTLHFKLYLKIEFK